MEYGVVAIAALGLTCGLLVKLHVFLPIVGLVLVASIFFAWFSGWAFGQAALAVLGSQFLLQLFYFIGVTVSVFVTRRRRDLPVL